MQTEWERALRDARRLSTAALDALATTTMQPMPNNLAGAALKEARTALVLAKGALDRYLDS